MKKLILAIAIAAGLVLAMRVFAQVPSTPNYWQAHGHTISPINPYGVSLGTATATNFTVTGTCTGCSTGGSGITSLNGLNGSSQTFATSSSGSIFNVTTVRL